MIRHRQALLLALTGALLVVGCADDVAESRLIDETPDAGASADLPDTSGAPDAGMQGVDAEDLASPDSGGPDQGEFEPDQGEFEPDAGAPVASRCEQVDDELVCEHETAVVAVGLLGADVRQVHQVPRGEAPEPGWPVAFFFQGSLFSSQAAWSGFEGAPFGAYHQARVIQALLDGGFAVIAPEARLNGATFWDTNIPPYNVAWRSSTDHDLMVELFEGIEQGEYGDLDASRLYATGISSGGYMTSRMAVSYEGRFRALAINAASYATCSGPACFVPSLPEDHPPTLFLHGELDGTVPIWTMRAYRDDLDAEGYITRTVVDAGAAHEWIEAAPGAILDWFLQH